MPIRDPRDPNFVNPHWVAPPEATPPRHRSSAAVYALAIVLPVFLLLLLAAPFGIVLALRTGGSTGQAPAGRSNQGADQPPAGEAGAGDPYFPDYGSTGYDALKYAISISFDPRTATISGTTTI